MFNVELLLICGLLPIAKNNFQLMQLTSSVPYPLPFTEVNGLNLINTPSPKSVRYPLPFTSVNGSEAV